MIVTVTLNPCVDLILFLDGLKAFDTNRVTRSEEDAGGKGINVSRVAAELGATTTATGLLGGGPGGYILSVLEKQGVISDFQMVARDTRLNVSVEDGSGQPPTTFNAKGPQIESAEWEGLLEKCSTSFAGASWVCLGGSLPPGVPVDAWRVLGDLARAKGAKVCLDADGPSMVEGIKMSPDLIKPNIKEAGRLLNRELAGRDQALEAASELRGALSGSADPMVLLSMGSEGAILSAGSGSWFVSAAKVTPVSTIGSGDSMIGGYLAGLVSGKSLEESLALGAAAGAATASTDGTEIARLGTVEQLLPTVVVSRLGV